MKSIRKWFQKMQQKYRKPIGYYVIVTYLPEEWAPESLEPVKFKQSYILPPSHTKLLMSGWEFKRSRQTVLLWNKTLHTFSVENIANISSVPFYYKKDIETLYNTDRTKDNQMIGYI